MIKLIPLLIKLGPIVWAFAKEVVFKREDKRYFIRNKLHVFITLVLIVQSITLYTLHEGYNSQARDADRKGKEIIQLLKVIDNKKEVIKLLRDAQCPEDIGLEMLQELADEKIIEDINKHQVKSKS